MQVRWDFHGERIIDRILKMKNIFIGIMFLISLSPVAVMADYQEGRDAFDRGDYSTALKEFKILVKQNDSRGQYALAVMYDLGEGVTKLQRSGEVLPARSRARSCRCAK